jgi:hypothetical protein
MRTCIGSLGTLVYSYFFWAEAGASAEATSMAVAMVRVCMDQGVGCEDVGNVGM